MPEIEHLLRNHCRLVTRDRDESAEKLGAVWERHHTELLGRRFFVRWHQVDLKQSSLAYVDHPCAVRAVCDGPLTDTFRLLFPFEGRIESRMNGKSGVASPAKATIHGPGQDLKLDIAPFRLLLLSLEGALVRSALQRRIGRVPPFETWATDFPMDAPGASALRSLCRWMATELDRPDSPLWRKPRTAAHVERLLLSLFLDVLEEQGAARHRGSDDLAEAQIRRIEDWVEANLAEAMCVEDLAAVADVSARSVQTAFRRLRDCTPMQFVQRRRLALARALLEDPAPETTVTEVALGCGCLHFGRFSVAYRTMFGEKPSETLARGRRSRRLATPSCPENETFSQGLVG